MWMWEADFDSVVSVQKVPTESITLNDITCGGLTTGDFIVISADSGLGKTTILQRFVLDTIKAGKKSLFVSIDEEDATEVFMRLLCMFCAIEYKGKTFNCYPEDEAAKLREKRSYDIWKLIAVEYVPTEGINIDMIMKWKEEYEFTYLYMDYIGCMESPDVRQSQYTYLGKISSWLKNFATQNNICVVTATQVNKEVNLNQPGLTNVQLAKMMNGNCIADSKNIARKATLGIILFDYNDQLYLNVYKNRLNGKKKLIPLTFRPKTFEWNELFIAKDGSKL